MAEDPSSENDPAKGRDMTRWPGSASCPTEGTLSRAFSDGTQRFFVWHLGSCDRCSAIWEQMAALRALSRMIRADAPDADRLEQTRTALLVSLARSRQFGPLPRRIAWRWRRVAFTLGGIVWLSFAAWTISTRVLHRVQPTPPIVKELRSFHAVIRPCSNTVLSVEGDEADDRVRLREGTASFDVVPLGPGQRFRVIVGDGEVEVRGTSFDVVADHDRLSDVRVRHGQVAVRTKERPDILLEAGEQWRADDWTTAAPADAAETAFVDAWSALRAGQFLSASRGFAISANLTNDPALAEDAQYWRVVALRDAKSNFAADELAAFLHKYPTSPHADDAAIALAWCYLEAGRHSAAEGWFRAMLNARDREVRKSARVGLQKLNASGR